MENGESELLLSVQQSRSDQKAWYVDSGATKHMTNDRQQMTSYIPYSQPHPVYLGDNRVHWAHNLLNRAVVQQASEPLLMERTRLAMKRVTAIECSKSTRLI